MRPPAPRERPSPMRTDSRVETGSRAGPGSWSGRRRDGLPAHRGRGRPVAGTPNRGLTIELQDRRPRSFPGPIQADRQPFPRRRPLGGRLRFLDALPRLLGRLVCRIAGAGASMGVLDRRATSTISSAARRGGSGPSASSPRGSGPRRSPSRNSAAPRAGRPRRSARSPDGRDAGRLGLEIEAADRGLVGELAGEDHLQRDATVEAHLRGLEDDAHAPAGQLADDLVIAEAADATGARGIGREALRAADIVDGGVLGRQQVVASCAEGLRHRQDGAGGLVGRSDARPHVDRQRARGLLPGASQVIPSSPTPRARSHMGRDRGSSAVSSGSSTSARSCSSLRHAVMRASPRSGQAIDDDGFASNLKIAHLLWDSFWIRNQHAVSGFRSSPRGSVRSRRLRKRSASARRPLARAPGRVNRITVQLARDRPLPYNWRTVTGSGQEKRDSSPSESILRGRRADASGHTEARHGHSRWGRTPSLAPRDPRNRRSLGALAARLLVAPADVDHSIAGRGLGIVGLGTLAGLADLLGLQALAAALPADFALPLPFPLRAGPVAPAWLEAWDCEVSAMTFCSGGSASVILNRPSAIVVSPGGWPIVAVRTGTAPGFHRRLRPAP